MVQHRSERNILLLIITNLKQFHLLLKYKNIKTTKFRFDSWHASCIGL